MTGTPMRIDGCYYERIGEAKVLFTDLTTEQLREMAATTHKATPWHKYDRAMLLAFHHNRHGKFVPSAY